MAAIRPSLLEAVIADGLHSDFSRARAFCTSELPEADRADWAVLLRILDEVAAVEPLDSDPQQEALAGSAFDAAVRLILGLGAIDAAERIGRDFLERNPGSVLFRGVLGLIRRAQGRTAEASQLLVPAAACAWELSRSDAVLLDHLRRCELVVDWNAQLQALLGDLPAIGRFAIFRDMIAHRFPERPGSAVARRLNGVPYLGKGEACNKIAVVEHFGLGDRLMFSRFYGALADSFPKSRITVICHPALIRLYTASFTERDDIAFMAENDIPDSYGPDCQVPAVAIPELIGVVSSAEASRLSFAALKPSMISVNRIRAELERLRVGDRTAGIVWRDSARWYQPFRFLSLAELGGRLVRSGYSLIALDPFVDRDEVRRFREEAGIRIITADDLTLVDMDDVAALMLQMDRIATIDKVFANLAGAMKLRGDVFLSTFVDYRWSTGPGPSPFYNSLRLHRQASYGDWRVPLAAFEQVAG